MLFHSIEEETMSTCATIGVGGLCIDLGAYIPQSID